VDDQKRRRGADLEATPNERGVASAIYGLVVCSATLAAASVSGELLFVAVSVLVTVLVYWVAESYANVLARHAVRQRPLGWSGILATLGQGWPMVSASFIPLATLLLAGALGESVFIAINLSLAVATALLVGAGWSASRASGLAGWRLLVSTAVSAVFGLTMVALKNLLHA
jgi:positive regulator of sigma E activity